MTRTERLKQIEKNGIGKCWIHPKARAEWAKMIDPDADADADAVIATTGCGRCLHPSFCMCSFTAVTPGCNGYFGSTNGAESDDDDSVGAAELLA